MTAGDGAPTQAEEPIIDIDAKDISVEASTKKVLTMKPVLKVATRKLLQSPILKLL